MNKLEPTYLRYVYDELNKGSLSSDNASSLPYGFVGLFEKEFSSDISVSQRRTTLKHLSLWAILKKPVSSEFVSDFLKVDGESTKSLIDTFSKWFNSPEPGKYVLFHDRLRSYLLQKISDHEVQELNEQLIAYLESSLKDSIGNESEVYALEYLSAHMAVESRLDNNYQRLHDFVNNKNLWTRQIKASKEYKWSQKAVQISIQEAARRNHENNLIESSNSIIDIQHQEESDYNYILNLIENDEFDLTLKRAFNWKGEKQIKLFLLILSETLFGKYHQKNIDSSFFNEISNKLKSLLSEENNSIKTIENDSSSDESKVDLKIHWKLFFPQTTMYCIHLEMGKREIDFSFIWKSIRHINYKELFYYDYSDIVPKNKSLIPIINDVLYKETGLDILFDNFLELAFYSIQNNYPGSFKEYMSVLDNVIQNYSFESSSYNSGYEKIIDIDNKLFNDDIKSLFDISNYKTDLIAELFLKIDEIKDFHQKKDIYILISGKFNKNNSKSNSLLSNQIIIFFNGTKLSDDYKLQATYGFADLLKKCYNYNQSFELVKDIEVYDYDYFFDFFDSSCNSLLKNNIVEKIIYSLNHENSYEVKIQNDEPVPRGLILIKLVNYYITNNDINSALEQLNKIDKHKESDLINDALINIANYYITNDDIKSALDQLHKFDSSGREIRGLTIDSYSLIVKKLADYNKDEYSYEIYTQIEKLIYDGRETTKISNGELLSIASSLKKNVKYSISSLELNKGIQKILNDIVFDYGQFICGEQNGFIDQLISHNHYDLAFDLISLLPMSKDYWRNKYFFDVGYLLLYQNRLIEAGSIFERIDSEIFQFHFAIVFMNKHIEKNNIEECYELINRFKNSILKTYLLFNLQYVLLKDQKDLKLINIESLISNISYSNTIIEISKCFSNENSCDFNKLISEEFKKEYVNNSTITADNLEEKIDEFYSNFYEMEALNCVNEGMEILSYFNSTNDDNFSIILDKLCFKIKEEESIFDSISDSFNNIMSLNLSKNNYSNDNKNFAKNIIEYIKSKNISVNSILLYDWASEFSSIPYIQFVIENNLIIYEIHNDDTVNKIFKLIIDQYQINKEYDLFHFIYNLNCLDELREELLDKILAYEKFSVFTLDEVNTLANICPKSSLKILQYAFSNKLFFAPLLLEDKNIKPTNKLESFNLIDNIDIHIKELENYNLILKCINDHKLLTYNRKSLSALSKNLSKLNLFNEALLIFELISEDDSVYYKDGEVNDENSLKSFVLRSISIDLLNCGFVDKSINTANKINDLNIRFRLYNKLRDILKYNSGNFDFSYEIEIFKLYNNQTQISKWSANYWEDIENALSTDIENIFNSLVEEFKRSKQNSDKKLEISNRISKFIDKYLEFEFINSSLNTKFIVKAVDFLLDSKLISDYSKKFRGYLEKILYHTENYLQNIIKNKREPNEDDNDRLYVGNILSILSEKLNDKSLLKIKNRFVDELIIIVNNPIIYESNDIDWDSYYQNSPYNAKLKEQSSWLNYASLSFDIFKNLNLINDSRSNDFLEKCLRYVSESEKQFYKNNKIQDLSKAYSDLRWYSGEKDIRYHHTAKSNTMLLEMLKYFSIKNDEENFNKILNLYSSPNLKSYNSEDFAFNNLETYNKKYNFKYDVNNIYKNLKSIDSNIRLNNSLGEINNIETIRKDDHKPVDYGIFCEKTFGELCLQSIKDIQTKRESEYGHVKLASSLIDLKEFTVETFSLITKIPNDLILKIINFEIYIVINAAGGVNNLGNLIEFKQTLTEDEYLDILDSFPTENMYFEDNDPKKFIAKNGPDAIRDLLLKSSNDNFSYNHHSKDFNLSVFIDLAFIDFVPVIHPNFRPLVLLENGQLSSSDINELYRKLIIRNNRLIRLVEIKAPAIILKSEKKKLQESYDVLQNSLYNKPVSDETDLKLLINFYMYMLKELRVFSIIFKSNLNYLNSLINKLDPNTNNISQYSIRICELLFRSYNYHIKNNDDKFCEELLILINTIEKDLSKEDIISLSLLRFKYLKNIDAFKYYNLNSSTINITNFSEQILNLISNNEVDFDNNFLYLNTFNTNVNIHKYYIKSLKLNNSTVLNSNQ